MGVYGSPEMHPKLNKNQPKYTADGKFVNCPKCGTQYSKNLSNCPDCGAINYSKNNALISWCVLIGLGLGLYTLAFLMQSDVLGSLIIIVAFIAMLSYIILGIIRLIRRQKPAKHCFFKAIYIFAISAMIISSSNTNQTVSEKPVSNTSDTGRTVVNAKTAINDENNSKEIERKLQEQQQFVPYSEDMWLSYDEYTKLCGSYNYNDLITNPEQYKGRKIKTSGNVIDIRTDGNKITFTLSNGLQRFYIKYYRFNDGETEIKRGNKINAYGELDGIVKYEETSNDTNTSPILNMIYWDFVESADNNSSYGLIDYNTFRKINNGMSYYQVKKLIGSEGTLLSSAGEGVYNTFSMQWNGYGSIGANAIITFQNNKVISKAQFGLQ